MRFPMIFKLTVIISWLSFFTVSFANAQNPSCVAPGTLVVTGAKEGATLPAFDIDKVYLAEPRNGDEAQTLTFTMKVASLDSKAGTGLPAGTWNVVFSNDSGETRFVQMSTLLGAPVYNYGTVSNMVGLPVYTAQGPVRGTYNKSGFITIHVDKTLVGKPSLGTSLTVAARTYQSVKGSGLVQADMAGSSSYQVLGSSDCSTTMQANFGMNGDVAVPYDYTQNGTTDIGVWRPSTGDWFTYDLQTGENSSFTIGSGANGDVPVVGDFDKDSKGDNVVYRSSTGSWFIHKTESGENSQVNFGMQEDLPVVGDFDGDKIDDIAVFRPSSGTWYVYNSSDATVSIVAFGTGGDRPIPADYDGDGRSDVAVFRPSTGMWFIYNSLDGSVTMANFGVSGDVVVPSDYDGDGKADLAVWRPESGDWYVYASATGSVMVVPWGTSTDLPQVGDFNGNGRADFAVWRPSSGDWFIDYN